MRTHQWKFSVAVLLVILVSNGFPALGADHPLHTDWVEGTLLLAWGTAAPGESMPRLTAAHLRGDGGAVTPLDLDASQLAALGGPMLANGARVRALLPGETGDDGRSAVRPLAIESEGGGGPGTDASGSYPYISIMCAFDGEPFPPQGLSYFQNMYANTWPGLDHYWRRQSYGMVDVVGSMAAGWYELPHSQTYYTDMIVGGDHSAMLNALYTDCTNAAVGINLGGYEGINLMFSNTFGCCAWGGWGGVTWEPPWGWQNVAVMGHEMGHAFGLPHSNNADNDGNPYDNPWDVMSDSWNSAMSDATYGVVGKHTITFHKDMLDWIPSSRKARVSTVGLHTFDIDHLTHAATTKLHMVQVDIPGSTRYYTIEVRDRFGYDGNLPGFAVILHEVDWGRPEPAWLIDIENVSNGGDAGAMWLPGECFDDLANEISICVESVTTEGYRVEVGYGDWGLVFENDFEAGNTGGWSGVVQ